ncbi:MAG: TIGR00303 family protein [bacterium]
MIKDVLQVKKNSHFEHFLKFIMGKKGIFVCTIATTKTAEIEGISAAGATPELRRYTAQADVEYLFYEKPITIPEIPKNPLGPPSPVVITKAALNLLKVPVIIIDGGCEIKAKVPQFIFREKGLNCITTGKAFENGEVLFEQADKLAVELSKFDSYVVIGESVPGGTTTALSLMTAFGIDAEGKVSSSMKENAHDIKKETVKRALKRANIKKDDVEKEPLKVVEKIGDSMQIINAALAMRLSHRVPVILAGGTQLIAVVCLMNMLERAKGYKVCWENISLITTRWVAEDRTADFRGLSEKVAEKITVLAANLNFSKSRFQALRMYEKGLVKEGVGAGGIAGAGFLTNSFTFPELMNEIESLYEKMGKGK